MIGKSRLRKLAQSFIAPGNEHLLIADIGRIELPLVEMPLDFNRRKVGMHDVLREHGIAANVPLAGRVQCLRIERPDHVAQIEIAVGEPCDITAANVAEISLIAFGHF